MREGDEVTRVRRQKWIYLASLVVLAFAALGIVAASGSPPLLTVTTACPKSANQEGLGSEWALDEPPDPVLLKAFFRELVLPT